MKFMLCLFLSIVSANEIELFMDWHPFVKNQEIFDTGLPQKIGFFGVLDHSFAILNLAMSQKKK